MNAKRKVHSSDKRILSELDLDAVTPRLTEEWVSLHRRRPRYLYHYTNAQGLLGMLESKRIWATNSRFMNDPTEIGYAIRLVREVMESVLKEDARWLNQVRKSVS